MLRSVASGDNGAVCRCVGLPADDVFDAFDVVACVDVDAERAEATADEHGIEAMAPDALLDDKSVEAIGNLTPPHVHAEVIASPGDPDHRERAAEG